MKDYNFILKENLHEPWRTLRFVPFLSFVFDGYVDFSDSTLVNTSICDLKFSISEMNKFTCYS